VTQIMESQLLLFAAFTTSVDQSIAFLGWVAQCRHTFAIHANISTLGILVTVTADNEVAS
jgi:hypothetical protein